MTELGRLEKVELRDVWSDEANDFTPWLAKEENLNVLADTIGLELELEATEKNVGPFKADILCKDTIEGHWVLIENQLEKTDHTHLGQLLTYASGLKAVTIVWVAKYFTEEHRAALDWLNEITDESFNFFGLEVELWRIGNSPVAPKFNIVCKPNEWSKNIQDSARNVGEMTPTKQEQLEFWTAFKDYLKNSGSSIRCHKARPQHWLTASIGKTGFYLSSIASTTPSSEIGVELVIDDKNSKILFKLLEEQREEIEREIGDKLTWHNPENKKMCRIYIRKSSDFMNAEDWTEQHEWLRRYLEKFYAVFSHRVKQLDASDYESESEKVTAETEKP